MRWLLVCVVAFGCSHKADDEKPPGEKPDPFLTFATTAPTVGQAAPAFELTSTTGEKVSLASVVKPVVLVFASFTCPPSRMKLPGFEALAERWKDRAAVLVIYSREAHAHSKNSERLNGFADQVQARDANHDGTITLAEYGDLGPRYMFDAFDLDHDGEVRSYELLAARRLPQFKDVDAPTTAAQRLALAQKLREQVPGKVPVLVDGMDDAVATAYGGLPNMAYVIAADGTVGFKIPWAAVADIERELARMTGAPVPAPVAAAPDLALLKEPLADAAAAHKPLLVELTAIGCHACEAMAKTIAEPEVAGDLAAYQVAQLGIDRDAAWKLFESLQLGATPAFVVVKPDGTIAASLQAPRDREALRAFLHAHATL